MIIDGQKTINELEELRYDYYKDIEQLQELYSRLRERCSKLSENDEIEEYNYLIDITEKSFRNIEEALHKLNEAGVGTEKLIQKYHAYLEVKFD